MKLGDRLAIKTTGRWLPERYESTSDAVAAGLITAEDEAKLGTVSLAVAGSDSPPPMMAVRAARSALDEAGWTGEQVGLALHAWIHHQGHDFWSPAHYVAAVVGANQALPLGVQQMCNGGPAALHVATRWLLTEPGSTALVTTADRFATPGFDRWGGDYGVMYGDSGTALLLHHRDGGDDELNLLAVASSAAPELERLHRGDDEFSPAARWHSTAVDVRRTKKAFFATAGVEILTETTLDHVKRLLLTSLADAGIDPDDDRITRIVLPRLGRAALDTAYRPALDGLTKAEVVDVGTKTGHLGAGDTTAGLHELTRSAPLQPGEIAAVISGGGGFTWSCVLVERPSEKGKS